MDYDGICEVVTGKAEVANHYLEHGYRLLSIMGTAQWKGRLNDDGVPAGGYVRKRIEFVVGRPEGVGHAEPPSKEA